MTSGQPEDQTTWRNRHAPCCAALQCGRLLLGRWRPGQGLTLMKSFQPTLGACNGYVAAAVDRDLREV